MQNDEQSARRHIPTVHIGAGQNTRGSSRTTSNLLTTQRQRRFQVEALKTEPKHSRYRSSYKTPQTAIPKIKLHHAFQNAVDRRLMVCTRVTEWVKPLSINVLADNLTTIKYWHETYSNCFVYKPIASTG
jgi:hypothetical protein